jgi:hypothetical protein
MGVEQTVATVRAAVIKMMDSKSHLRPSGLIESLVRETGEPRISVQQALARLFREKWISGVSAHGEAIGAVKIIGHVPPPPPNPDLDRWHGTLEEEAGLEERDVLALMPLYKPLACFDAVTQKQIIAGLLHLRENMEQEAGRHRFVVSARYLIGSSKFLDSMPAPALKAFGIQVERFPSHPLYVVAAGCAEPETVVLVENPAAFEMAVVTGAARRCAFIATFGFGLSKNEDDYGKQLASMVEERFSSAITLMREGSSCPTAKELLNHPNITFWGDLDVAGIQIFQRLKRNIPSLSLSALYKPMLEKLEGPAGSHPYVPVVGKPGQQDRYATVRCEDLIVEKILARCSTRGVDQECVLPEQIEQFAAYELLLEV